VVIFDLNSLHSCTYHTPRNLHHTGTGSNLVQGRIDIDKQIFNYNVYMYNFNHFNKQTILLLLLFHQFILTFIILTRTYKFLRYCYHNVRLLLPVLLLLWFEEMLLPAP